MIEVKTFAAGEVVLCPAEPNQSFRASFFLPRFA
jgi:hypothetical protein